MLLRLQLLSVVHGHPQFPSVLAAELDAAAAPAGHDSLHCKSGAKTLGNFFGEAGPGEKPQLPAALRETDGQEQPPLAAEV